MNKTAWTIATTLAALKLLGEVELSWLVVTSPLWGALVADAAEKGFEQAKKTLGLGK